MEGKGEKNKSRGLTIEQLRSFKNCERISDEQAQEAIFAIKNLANIFYEYLNMKKSETENSGENKSSDDETELNNTTGIEQSPKERSNRKKRKE